MYEVAQITLGVWFGLSLFALSVAVVISAMEQISKNRRLGRPWYELGQRWR